MRLGKTLIGAFLIVVLVNGCQPSGRINIKPADTKTAAVPTAPPTN